MDNVNADVEVAAESSTGTQAAEVITTLGMTHVITSAGRTGNGGHETRTGS